MKTLNFAIIMGTVFLPLIGCQAPQKPTGPTEKIINIPDYDRFVDCTLTTLRERDFTPAYVDRNDGVILTKRTTGGQWFEFARCDSQGAYQRFESSIHTIGRTVRIEIEPTDASKTERAEMPKAGQYRVNIEVEKTRLSAPERQVTTASGALAIFSERMPTEQGLRGKASRSGIHWVPLGRDGLLESYLLDKFLVADKSATVVK